MCFMIVVVNSLSSFLFSPVFHHQKKKKKKKEKKKEREMVEGEGAPYSPFSLSPIRAHAYTADSRHH